MTYNSTLGLNQGDMERLNPSLGTWEFPLPVSRPSCCDHHQQMDTSAGKRAASDTTNPGSKKARNKTNKRVYYMYCDVKAYVRHAPN